MKDEVDILGSPSLTVLMVSVDVKRKAKFEEEADYTLCMLSVAVT